MTYVEYVSASVRASDEKQKHNQSTKVQNVTLDAFGTVKVKKQDARRQNKCAKVKGYIASMLRSISLLVLLLCFKISCQQC